MKNDSIHAVKISEISQKLRTKYFSDQLKVAVFRHLWYLLTFEFVDLPSHKIHDS